MGCGSASKSEDSEKKDQELKEKQKSEELKEQGLDINQALGLEGKDNIEDSNNQLVQKPSSVVLVKTNNFGRKKVNFLSNHKIFQKLILTKDFAEYFNKFKDEIEGNVEQNKIDQFYNHFESKLTTEISRENFSKLIKEIVSEDYIVNILRFRDWNVSKIFKFYLESFEDKEFENQVTMILNQLNKDKIIPSIMKGLLYQHNEDDDFEGVNSNLKFYPIYQCKLLNFPLNSKNFLNEAYLVDLCEIIENSEELLIIMVVFLFEEGDSVKLDPVVKILESIYVNYHKYKKLRAIMLGFDFETDEQIIGELPSDFYSILGKIVKTSTNLIALGLHQINIKTTASNFFNSLIQSNLKFLYICPTPLYELDLFDKYMNVLLSNKKLKFSLFVGFNELKDKFGTFSKKIQESNPGHMIKFIQEILDFYI